MPAVSVIVRASQMPAFGPLDSSVRRRTDEKTMQCATLRGPELRAAKAGSEEGAAPKRG
jgi:hypothetical protein